MNDHFDAYHKWLGIPPGHQPPDHYRLLGLRRFEADAEVIGNASDQRMRFLRTLQTGAHAAESQRLLNEVARARVTLLDPARKAGYDAVLCSAAPVDSAPAGPRPLEAPPVQAAPAASVGQSFGEFRLVECLQHTRMAMVYRAEHTPTGRLYSLKFLTPEAARDGTMRKRFRREIEITTQLDHPHLIVGYQGGEHQGLLYLVTEYVIGTDLQTLVAKRGPLPIEHVLEYVEQAARGLMQLHLLGVYHRNISPRNLLVDLQGRIKVTNLLLARIQEGSEMDQGQEELTRMGDVMGTAEFLAPEQVLDASSVDQRTDVYSLGCTMFYLATGRAPYGGRSLMDKLAAHKTQPIPSMRDHRPDVPGWLDTVCRKMLVKEPGGRYTTMAYLTAALDARRRLPWWVRAWRRLFGSQGA